MDSSERQKLWVDPGIREGNNMVGLSPGALPSLHSKYQRKIP